MLFSYQNITGDPMSKAFTAEFKLEAAKLVLDQNYTHTEAAKAWNVQAAVSSKTQSPGDRRIALSCRD